jgi:ribosomal protein L40E
MKRLWKGASLKKVQCADCGNERLSYLTGKNVCQSCYTRSKNGASRCRGGCGKDKVIVNLEHRLCKHCYEDFTAARNLRRYLDNYSSPFPQNDYYLALLSESIVWEKVTAKTLRRFRAVGNFLLGHELLQPPTWEAIEGSLPSLGDEKRYGTKLIRSCLRDLGHLLADRGQLESWADYVSRRRTLQPLDRLPAYFKPDLTRYRDWLVHDRHRPSSIRSSLYSIAYFFSWCFGLGINSLSEINPLTVEGYQQTLYWEWVCKSCGRAAPFEPWQRNLTGGCTSRDCKSAASYERRRRHSQSYVRTQTSNLSTFFDWAKHHGRAHVNPVQCGVREDERKITHYSAQVYDRLCEQLKSPEADPEEALALYLISFHGFKVDELRLAQNPSLPASPPEEHGVDSPGDDFYLMLAPQPRPRARFAGRRPGTRIDFPAQAGPWLRPLLARYAQRRASGVGNTNNQYLFVSSRSARHNLPVSREHIRRLVTRATKRALGAAANASALRRTTGVIFTDECPRRGAVLTRLGWGAQRANNYTYMKRRVIHPQGT